MPYIKNIDRDSFNKIIEKTSSSILSEGEINYFISKLLHNYLKNNGVCYSNINKLIGVLECAKLELYRKIAAPYEDKKEIQNGKISKLT